jgi:hypothetical protein
MSMRKSQNKTRPTAVTPASFIAKLADPQQRKDSQELVKLFRKITGKAPKMWGPSIIGFDSYHYVYESGREGDAPLIGFSPRKPELVLYMSGGGDKGLAAKLGKHKAGVSCLYVKKLDDIDRAVLEQLAKRSIAEVRKKYPK